MSKKNDYIDRKVQAYRHMIIELESQISELEELKTGETKNEEYINKNIANNTAISSNSNDCNTE